MSPMNPFDTAGHLASIWGRSGDALLDAQRSLVQEMTGWMPSVAPEPVAPNEGYEAARRAFARSWETALDVSRTAAANLSGPIDPALATTLDQLLDPAAWFARGSGHEPRAGDIAATTSLAEAATLLRRRDLEHDVILLETWMQAAGAFARALHAAAGQGVAPDTPESVIALWSDHADPVFTEAERSDAFRRSRDRLAVARAELETAQRAVGRIYGYASRRDLDELRDAVEGLRRQLDEILIRREPDAPAPALSSDVAALERGRETTDTEPGLLCRDDAARTPEPAEGRAEVELRPESNEPPPRYIVRSRDGEGPGLLLLGAPDDPAAHEIADALVRRNIAMHEVVWSEAAWRGSLEDLVRDLASVMDDLVHEVAPIAIVGVGPGAIPLVCLASRRDLPALVVVEAAFGFDTVDLNRHGPDWLTAIRRDDSAMRGTLTVDGQLIDLSAITCPVLNLVPAGANASPEAARALAHLVASDDYAERPVSAPREAGPVIADWLANGIASDRDGTTS